MTDVTIFQDLFDRYLTQYAAQDAQGCAACYVKDGVILSPFGPPAIGQDAIAATHTLWFQEAEQNKSLTVHHAWIDGALGVCLAEYAADLPQQDGTVTRDRGMSLNSLRLVAPGTWRLYQTSLTPLVS